MEEKKPHDLVSCSEHKTLGKWKRRAGYARRFTLTIQIEASVLFLAALFVIFFDDVQGEPVLKFHAGGAEDGP